MSINFIPVFQAWPELLQGVLGTLILSVASIILGLVLSVLGAIGKVYGPSWLRFIIHEFIVELFRNTPLIVQIFLIYFGLAELGLRMSSMTASVLALTVNISALGIETIRAGIENVPKGQIDAGKSLGLKSRHIFQYIILKPSLQAVYPSMTSIFILLMLNTSVCSVIAADELTGIAGAIGHQTFRSFEVYFVVIVLYLLLAAFFWTIFAIIKRTWMRLPSQ